jgi:hypothetical protein
MAKCINIGHPDFKRLADDSGLEPMLLSAKMGVWMEQNNTDEWPTLEQLGILKEIGNSNQNKINELINELDLLNYSINNYEQSKNFTPFDENYYEKLVINDLSKEELINLQSDLSNDLLFYIEQEEEQNKLSKLNDIEKLVTYDDQTLKWLGPKLQGKAYYSVSDNIIISSKNIYSYLNNIHDELEARTGGGEHAYFEYLDKIRNTGKPYYEGVKISYIKDTVRLEYDIDNFLEKSNNKDTKEYKFEVLYNAAKSLTKKVSNTKLSIPELKYTGTLYDFVGIKEGSIILAKELLPEEHLQQIKSALLSDNELTVEKVESLILGWGDTIAKTKYQGVIHRKAEPTTKDDLNRTRMMNHFISIINGAIPGLITMNTIPKKYGPKDPMYGNNWYPITISEKAIEDHNNNIKGSDLVTAGQQLELRFPEIFKGRINTVPVEYDDINNEELGTFYPSLMHATLVHMTTFFNENRNNEDAINWLDQIQRMIGISNEQRDLLELFKDNTRVSNTTLKVIERKDLDTIHNGFYKKYIDGPAFMYYDPKTNTRIVYLIKDNILLPNFSYDLLTETILHELGHQNTAEAILSPSNEADLEFKEKVSQLYRMAKKQSKLAEVGTYGYTSLAEFVVEGLANNAVIKELKEMKYNWWERFIKLITDFFTGKWSQLAEDIRPSKSYYNQLFDSLLSYNTKIGLKNNIDDKEIALQKYISNIWLSTSTNVGSIAENTQNVLKYLSALHTKFKERSNNPIDPTNFETVEHSINRINFGGAGSTLRLKEKPLPDMTLNWGFSSIDKAMKNYNGRYNLDDATKQMIVNQFHDKFGKDAYVILNAHVHNYAQGNFDIIDFIIIHTAPTEDGKKSVVYSVVQLNDTNGEMSDFEKLKMPEERGLFLPGSEKDRHTMRLNYIVGTFNTRFANVDPKYRFTMPVYTKDNNTYTSDLTGNNEPLIELKRSPLSSLLFSDIFAESRKEEYASDVVDSDDITNKLVMEQYEDFYTKHVREQKEALTEIQEVLMKTLTSLSRRMNVEKIYGNKINALDIQDLIKSVITNFDEPAQAMTDVVNYAYGLLANAEEELRKANKGTTTITKQRLNRYRNMTASFAVLKDIETYLTNTFGNVGGIENRDMLSQSIKHLAYVEIEYKNRSIELLVDAIVPYYSRIKVEQIESYKREYRRYHNWIKQQAKGKLLDKKVPDNFNRDLTQDEYVSQRYLVNKDTIDSETKLAIRKELKMAKQDVNYLEMLFDNILDSADPVIGAYVKKLSILDDEVRFKVEEERLKRVEIAREFEDYMRTSGKTFNDYSDIYDFMLERDSKTHKLTGHIITKFPSYLLEEHKRILLAAEFYTNSRMRRAFVNAWYEINMPLNEDAYIEGLQKFLVESFESTDPTKKITENEVDFLNSKLLVKDKYFDVKQFIIDGNITEETGNLVYEWIKKNRNSYRELGEGIENKQWDELQKILSDPNDVRTKVYNTIVEMQREGDSRIPSSLAIGTHLPGVIKQKNERFASGQNLWAIITNSLNKTFTFQVDDTHRSKEIINEKGEALYWIPTHFTNKVLKKEGEEWVFDEDNQSFDLLGIYFSYLSSAINYKMKHTNLAEIDMFRNIIAQREVSKSGTTSTLKQAKKKMKELLNISGNDSAVVVGGNISQMLNIWLEVTHFGQAEKDMGTLFGIDIGKMLKFVKKYTAANLMGLNAIMSVSNVSLGEISQWIESIAGELIDPKSYGKAHVDFAENLVGIMTDIGTRTPTNELNLLAQHFDITEMPSPGELGKASRMASLDLQDFISLTNTWGEYFMRVKMLDAMLYHKRAYDKDGKDIGSIRDFYKLDENGKLVFDKDGKVDLVRSQWEDTPEHQDRENFKLKVEGELGRIHGDYSNLAKVAAEQNALLAMAYMFRRFMVPGIRRHWGKERYEERIQKSVEGMYVTTWKKIIKPAFGDIKDFVNVNLLRRDLESKLSEMKTMTWGERWVELSDFEKANCIRTLLELVNIALIITLTRLIEGDDDEELTYADNFLIYQLFRLKSELMFYISPKQASNILRSPMASMSMFENAMKFIMQAFNPLETYERGPWEGQLKLYKDLVNLTPVLRQGYRLKNIDTQIPIFAR